MSVYIDLHMHSSYSTDGEIAPEVLIQKCRDNGIRIMAIADHDNVKGVAEGLAAAEKYGITCIPAIELFAAFKENWYHVLGYGIDYMNPVFNDFGAKLDAQYMAMNDKLLELTNALGFELTKEQMDRYSEGAYYIYEEFAEALLDDPRYVDSELLKPYRKGGVKGDNPCVNFAWDFYTKGKPCYLKMEFPPMEEVLEAIHESGGVSVLAHPGQNLGKHLELFDEIVELGIQGVEAFSSYHTPEQSSYFLEKGKEYGLLITCGSDYHGKLKPEVVLGGNGCTIDQKEIEKQLKEYRLI